MVNWFTTLLGKRARLRRPSHIEAVARHNHFLWPNLAEAGAQSRLYQQSPWVYIAVNRIAEAVALTPLRVMRQEAGRRVEVERHPLQILLDAPNPFLSRFELLEQTVGFLELTGNAYWFLAGDDAGDPVEIWPLRPDRVSIVPDPARHVKGYLYEIDGLRIPLDPLEVVHFKRWHPANDYYGLSALEAACLAVASDQAMAEWNRNTFSMENGVPAGIVTIKDFVTDADYDRIKREWRQSYGGTQRRTAFLRGDGIEWQNIGLSYHELDFLKGRQAHRDEILNIFGVPVGLVSENATEANAQVAERLFIERTLWPKLTRLSQKITQDVLPFWPGSYTAEFEDIRPTDVAARMDEIRTAYPLLSINEIRARYYQLPAVEWGARPAGMRPPAAQAAEQDVANTRYAPSVPSTASSPANGSTPGGKANPPDDAGDPAQDALSELSRWERFTMKRWGRTGGRPFEVRALPGEVAFAVSAGLLAAATPEEAREVFAQARAEVGQA